MNVICKKYELCYVITITLLMHSLLGLFGVVLSIWRCWKPLKKGGPHLQCRSVCELLYPLWLMEGIYNMFTKKQIFHAMGWGYEGLIFLLVEFQSLVFNNLVWKGLVKCIITFNKVLNYIFFYLYWFLFTNYN
jgi:hypothetical protein